MCDYKKLTILGIGNILLKDEGFGVHFVSWFEKRWRLPEDVDIVDGGTLGYVLLDIMSRCERMIIIDIMRLEDEPGSIYRFTREEMESHLPPPTTAHEVTFADVLFKADLMGECPEMVFLCIVPKAYGDLDLEMTPLIREKFPEMERVLLKELAKNDIIAERLDHA
ncbi:MAG: HyaD/HybD family hydrogenase maturation endopeptidase [Syntrophales bacterium]|nr:HyaD/HybD family hydrogenase maturation endopeptidase [Syntrophales bacterium]